MSDKKEKDSKVKSSKAKKNVEKTQEVSVSADISPQLYGLWCA